MLCRADSRRAEALGGDARDARREVHDAILDAVNALVVERGLMDVTLSQIAEGAGIGRTTLYKYVPDVQAVLLAWHDRQIARHRAQLSEVRDRTSDDARLPAVLEAYALLSRERQHHVGVSGLRPGHEHLARAEQEVHAMVRDLLGTAVPHRPGA
jgi:AcrR family transcriptional regulator